MPSSVCMPRVIYIKSVCSYRHTHTMHRNFYTAKFNKQKATDDESKAAATTSLVYFATIQQRGKKTHAHIVPS